MTDEQFNELRSIQLAQLALLECINANIVDFAVKNFGSTATPGHNWDRAIKLRDEAARKLASLKTP